MYEYGARAGVLAALALFHRAQAAGDGLRRRHRADAGAAAAGRHAGGRLGDRQPRSAAGCSTRTCPRPRSASSIAEAIRLHTVATGERPLRLVHRPLVARRPSIWSSEAGGFAWISDTYDDDLPYWRVHNGKPHAGDPPIPSRSTTCASSPRRASTMARNTSSSSRTASTCSTKKAAVACPR